MNDLPDLETIPPGRYRGKSGKVYQVMSDKSVCQVVWNRKGAEKLVKVLNSERQRARQLKRLEREAAWEGA